MALRGRVAAVVLVSLVVAVLAGIGTARDVDGDVLARLDRDADRVSSIVSLELSRYATASQALAAIRPSSSSVTDWSVAVDQLRVEEGLVAVYSVGALRVVDVADVPALESELAALDVSGVTIRPSLDERATPPTRVGVIDRVHPVEPNLPALGFDVLTNPAAAAGAERAMLTGRPSMSDALTLVQEPGDQTGLVVYAPWYDGGELVGLTNLVLRGADFLDGLSSEIGELAVQATDLVDGTPRLIGVTGDVDTEFRAERVLEVMGQRWQLLVAAPPDYATASELAAPWLLSSTFLVIGLLIAAVVHVLGRREEHAVALTAERTAALVAANAELEVAVRARDEFLSVVSHEMRTPVTVIRGLASTAAAGRIGSLPDTFVDAAGRIERQSIRLGRLVEDVLTAAQLRSGQFSAVPRDVDLARLLPDVAAEREAEVPDLHVDVEEAVTARVDPRHLRRCLGALLANAAVYGAPPVVLRAHRDGDEVVVQVRDHGPGVPAAVAERIFEPFEQADEGVTRESRGIGLGLTIVQELMIRNHGSVRLVEVAGPGAVFELRLPSAPDADGATAPTSRDAATRG